MAKFASALVSACVLFLGVATGAAPTFPYTSRTADYSAWTPATQSDINTTGLAGATVALATSISSAEENPAGYALETQNVSAVFNQTSFNDYRLQPDGAPMTGYQGGFAVSPPPWGFCLAYYSPTTEEDSYFSPNTNDLLPTEVSLREFRLTVARTFFDSHLALGVSGEVVSAIRNLGVYDYGNNGLSYMVGALWRLPEHVVLGASFAPEVSIGPSPNQDQLEMPGFNRALWRPAELNIGAGWLPNRFFKLGVQLSYVGSTPNTALLSDQTVITGAEDVLIPRVGASYILANYKYLTSVLAVGSYYETSRLSGYDNRLHGTAGFEINPFFLNLGIGLDYANDYQNVILGLGIDLIRTARLLSIIPDDPTPPYNGFFPQIDHISADGLPEAMTTGERRQTKPDSLEKVENIVKDVPGNIVNIFSGKPTTVQEEKFDETKKRLEKLKAQKVERDRRERLRREKIRQEKLREAKLRREKLRVERLRREKIAEEKLRAEKLKRKAKRTNTENSGSRQGTPQGTPHSAPHVRASSASPPSATSGVEDGSPQPATP